jgi:hypothetical protein
MVPQKFFVVQDNQQRLASLPKEGRAGWRDSQGAWPGPPEHPQRPSRAGNW